MANQPRYFNVDDYLWVFFNDNQKGLTERHFWRAEVPYDVSHQFKVTEGYRGVKIGRYDVDMVVAEGDGMNFPELNYEGAVQLLRQRGLGNLEAYLPKG